MELKDAYEAGRIVGFREGYDWHGKEAASWGDAKPIYVESKSPTPTLDEWAKAIHAATGQWPNRRRLRRLLPTLQARYTPLGD